MAIPRLHGLVPAAGSGTRLGAERPKQYLELGGRTLLEHAVASLLADPRVERALVVVAPGDERAARLELGDRVQLAAVGGPTRAASVRAGLAQLAQSAAADDFVLVHDAARPCLDHRDLTRLIDAVVDDPVGGLLALPVADTIKRSAGGRVAATVDRGGLWRALTPQMFRLGVLREALDAALRAAPDAVTDESGAVERLGHSPLLVAGRSSNLKVTVAADLEFAALLLADRGSGWSAGGGPGPRGPSGVASTTPIEGDTRWI